MTTDLSTNPPPKKLYSLRWRLLLSVIGITVFFWLISLAIIVSVSLNETSEVFDDALKKSASLLLYSTRSDQLVYQDYYPPKMNKTPDEDDLHFQIIKNGQVVSKTKEAPAVPFVAYFEGHKQKGFRDIMLAGEPWRIYIIRDKTRDFEVQVGQAMEMRFDILEELTEDLVIPALILLLFLGIVSAYTIYRLLDPLTSIARALGNTTVYQLDRLAVTPGSKELYAITQALDQLFIRLKHTLENERRFTADAAHELRTPLAALGMEAQLLARTYPQMAEALQKLRTDIDRAAHLVQHLLTLARLDPLNEQDQTALSGTWVSMQVLLSELYNHFSGRAMEKNITLDFSTHVPRAYLNVEMMRLCLQNLIDNAIRYCPKETLITLTVGAEKYYLVITVTDNGAGVSDEVIHQLTRRFYRVLGTGERGSGLGLSIVERIIKLHQGTMTIYSGSQYPGMKFVIRLPQPEVVHE